MICQTCKKPLKTIFNPKLFYVCDCYTKAHSIFIPNRLELVKKLVISKDVLDVGCIGNDNRMNPFDIVRRYSKDYVGVDLKYHYHYRNMITIGNAESINLRRKFDVIIAGDIIEHLNNPGIFLKNMKKHLKKDGILFISTPNIRSRCVLPNYKTNTTHTLWHDQTTLKHLLTSNGWKIQSFHFYPGNKKLSCLFEWFRQFYGRLFPSLSEGMITISTK